MARNPDWTEDEITMACALYLQPRGRRVDDVRLMEAATGRSPKSIGAKWDNLASLDYAAIGSDKSGLTHRNRLDDVVWNKFSQSPDAMFRRADELFRSRSVDAGPRLEYVVREEEVLDQPLARLPPGLDRAALAKERVGQDSLRRLAIRSAQGRCCVTGISQREILVASHIKPWAESTPEERTDVHNVLCLNTFHDGLFDSHLMTVTCDMRIHYADCLAESLGEEVCESMVYRYEKVRTHRGSEPDPLYLEIHNAEFERLHGRIGGRRSPLSRRRPALCSRRSPPSARTPICRRQSTPVRRAPRGPFGRGRRCARTSPPSTRSCASA